MVLRVLAEEHPQSVRQVFYRCIDSDAGPARVHKSDSGYRKVARACLQLRRDGRLPWQCIEDYTRRGHHVRTWRSARSFLRDFAMLYRAPLWDDCRVHVEVWCESANVGATVSGVCRELAVSLYPCHGQSSDTLLWQASAALEDESRPIRIVYVGDWDKAGVSIERNVGRKLSSFLPGKDVRVHRVAVTREQADHLPSNPDAATWAGGPSVQAAAIRADDLRAMVREAVEAHLPPGALDAAKVAEESERDLLLQLARGRRVTRATWAEAGP